ncbi:glycosyltransferase family 2 protein [Cesiribacter andamanensis]|uniref:dTDP-Rha:alpha-D-GlcNAc-pyrophosphate polyprenol, alpha-3-L-rhamnosyltransferase n=1 Tax=Cesiribacter andamanensis AMV16 TaxID=1279009 RepID=M7N3C3_9BACT|nr:glycosyltransferase family 2 protein [Cesiribacter andamanensis]EMR03188.1 dTDP-Rha:alpha-D-GlcNAc-pyrophosphate polyprenol, alpha-3-L-rhamnosyltransferase [Cesiribacter andamanensis AMV16]
MNQQLALVILNYNGAHFLAEFLPGVLEHSPGCRIIVADNASTDHSLALLAERFPQVEVLPLSRNFGFAGGYNEALRQIDTPYYLLLNSDVAVTPGWLDPLLSLMEANPAIAACQPKIKAYHQPRYFEYAGAAGGYLDWLAYPFCRGRLFDTLEEDKGQYNLPRPVFWATGACMLIRSRVFWEAGGFDKDFFAHMEEIDLCWRIHGLGYEVWAQPASVVFHVGGGTLPKENPRKTYLNFRNGLWMLIKNADNDLIYKLPLRVGLDWAASLQFLLQGKGPSAKAVLKSHLDTLKSVEKLHTKRREIEKKQLGKAPLFPKLVVFEYFFRKRKFFSQLE